MSSEWLNHFTEDLQSQSFHHVFALSHQSEEDGWCVGVLNGRQGLFPDNFVQFSRGEDVSTFSISGELLCSV